MSHTPPRRKQSDTIAIQCVRNTPTKDYLSVSPRDHKQESGSAPESRIPAIATEAGSDRRGSVPELSPTYAPATAFSYLQQLHIDTQSFGRPASFNHLVASSAGHSYRFLQNTKTFIFKILSNKFIFAC